MIALKDLNDFEYSDLLLVNTKERMYTGWLTDIKRRSHFPDIIEIRLCDYYTDETICVSLDDIIWVSYSEEDLDLGI